MDGTVDRVAALTSYQTLTRPPVSTGTEAGPSPTATGTSAAAAIVAGLASLGASAVSASADFVAGEHTLTVTRSGSDLVVSLDGGAGVVVSGGSPVILRGARGTLTISFGAAETRAPKAPDDAGKGDGGTLQALSRLGVHIAGRAG